MVAKRLADVNIAIDIPGSKEKGPSELKGVLSQPVLVVTRGRSAPCRLKIVLPKEVEYRCASQIGDAISLALRIH